MTFDNVNGVIKESLLCRYKIELETSMRGSDFIFDGVNLIYYITNVIKKFKRGGSYIDSLNWIKKNKATINLKKRDGKCFQYAATVPLNCEETKWNPEIISNMKPFINKYNWDKIKNPSKIDDWKTFEKNNLMISLNVFKYQRKGNMPSLYFKI